MIMPLMHLQGLSLPYLEWVEVTVYEFIETNEELQLSFFGISNLKQKLHQ